MNSQLLANALLREKQFVLLETEPTAAAILATAAIEKPDVVLLSACLEENKSLGFQVARQLQTANAQVKIVVLLDVAERSAVIEAFRAGARGVFCRTEPLKSLSKCIRCVHEGQVWAGSNELRYVLEALSQDVSRRMVGVGGLPLSRREQEVVLGVAEGLSNREIAARLGLTEHTVKNYLFRIFDKLGVSSRVEVVLYAFNMNSTPAPPRATAPASGSKTFSPEHSRKPHSTIGTPKPEPRPN